MARSKAIWLVRELYDGAAAAFTVKRELLRWLQDFPQSWLDEYRVERIPDGAAPSFKSKPAFHETQSWSVREFLKENQ